MMSNNLTIPNYNVEEIYIDGSTIIKDDRIFIKKDNEWSDVVTTLDNSSYSDIYSDISATIKSNPPIRYKSTCAYCGAPINDEGKCEYCGVSHQYL